MIETHCRACGVYKLEDCLNKCDYCCCYFCRLHFIISEDKCDECYMTVKAPDNEQQSLLIPNIDKVIVFYGISKDKKPVMMEFKTQ